MSNLVQKFQEYSEWRSAVTSVLRRYQTWASALKLSDLASDRRILPSVAGRITMCPIELLYDETFPSCIRLLPMETQVESQSSG